MELVQLAAKDGSRMVVGWLLRWWSYGFKMVSAWFEDGRHTRKWTRKQWTRTRSTKKHAIHVEE
eukprot:9118220-Heterocapsa_arctica.AAC.1